MELTNELFKDVKKLPVLPLILLELMDSFSDEDVRVEDIAAKVAKDQSISAKVIRMANSAVYRRGKEVESIDEAVIRLGFNQVRSIVVAATLSNVFPETPSFDKDKFWEETFITASIAKHLAKHTNINSDTAFTCAMMHNIGELLLQTIKPTECGLIKIAIDAGQPRLYAEREVLGFDNTQVGAALAKHWSFSSVFVDAIEQQLDPLEYENTSQAAVLIRLSVFTRFAWSLNLPPETIIKRFPEPLTQAINLKQEGLLETFAKMIEEGQTLARDIKS